MSKIKKSRITESDYKPTAQELAYKHTAQEIAAIEKIRKRREASLAIRLKVSKNNGIPVVGVDYRDKPTGQLLLMEALGSSDPDFVNGILSQLVNAGSKGHEVDEKELNFMLSVIKGIAPQDQLEAMIAAQMAAVHMAAMTFARRLTNVDNIPQQDSAERAYNKLSRTFLAQVEGLKRYRTGGEQKVTVQHVSVSEGGQAIVGNVTQTQQEKSPNKTATSQPALTDARAAPMPMIDDDRERTPVPALRKRNK
jgi:hypothetical protein